MKRSTFYVLLGYAVLALAFLVGLGLYHVTHANPDENLPANIPSHTTMPSPMWWWGSPGGRAWIAALPIIARASAQEQREEN